MSKYNASSHSTYNVVIPHCILTQIQLLPPSLSCSGKTQDSAAPECLSSWNSYSDYGSNARSRASVHHCKDDNTGTPVDLSSEGLFLVLHAERIRIPAEISVIVDTVLLRGDRRTYIGKDRGALYRKSKNKILTPFHLPAETREDSRTIS